MDKMPGVKVCGFVASTPPQGVFILFHAMLQRRTASNGVVFYVSPLLEAAGVPHGFSTRIGGVSGGAFASLNLGNPSTGPQDTQESIAENLQRYTAAIHCTARKLTSVRQVHGATVVDAQSLPDACQADALVSDDPGLAVCVRTADCVPVLVSDSQGRIVAAVHAGWRGVVAGVVPAAMATLRQRAADRSWRAAIGPSIGFEAFEVGPEVVEAFERHFGRAPFIRRRTDGKGHVDLRTAIWRQLLDCGLSQETIDTTDRCTWRDEDEFFSHRRDQGRTGRMLAAIAPQA